MHMHLLQFHRQRTAAQPDQSTLQTSVTKSARKREAVLANAAAEELICPRLPSAAVAELE